MDGQAAEEAAAAPSLAPEVARSIAAWAAGANLSGAVVIFVYLQYLSPRGLSNIHIRPGHLRTATIVFVAYTAGALVAGTAAILRYASRWCGWLRRGEAPDHMERRRTLQLPAFAAGTFLAGWAGAAVVFGALQVILGYPLIELLRIVVGILFAGLVTSAIGFSVVERAFRPVIAAALRGREEAVTSRGLGIRARVGLAWALGSAVPLLGLALAGATLEGVSWRLKLPMVALAGLGLVAGGALTRALALAVAVPLEQVRSVVEAVRDGDLDVSVPVDDGGDLGLLQLGVNRMVEATRERMRLQDIFGRHVGEAVAKAAVEGDETLGGECVRASVLFADVVGSTALALTREPAEVVELLNAFFGCVVEATAAEGGFVNKFAGDGALCVFGPPGSSDDHAARALAAARRLQGLLATARNEMGDLDAGIGVSSGPVVAGNVGAADRFEYTVIGDPVNEASRLSDLAKRQPGRVLASRPALDEAGAPESERWRPIGSTVLRGRREPTDLFVPLGDDAAPLGSARRRRRRRRRAESR